MDLSQWGKKATNMRPVSKHLAAKAILILRLGGEILLFLASSYGLDLNLLHKICLGPEKAMIK